MVFSRFPIEHREFVSFNDYKDDDKWADKGVALLRIRRSPAMTINLLVTHLQAAYKNLTQYSDVRRKQLKQVQALVQAKGAPDGNTGKRSITLVAGDINIHGNFTDIYGQQMGRSEWKDTFVSGGAVPWYTYAMQDGWETFISPSGRPDDPGITHSSRLEDSDEFVQSRLDYILLRKTDHPDPQERPEFSIHRMKLAHRGISDHCGVAAEINLHHDYCCPRQALTIAKAIQLPDIGKVSPDNGQVAADLENAGMIWLRIKKNGTYSVTADVNTAFELYSPDNMSTPLVVRYRTDLTKIPGSDGAWGDRDLPGTLGGPLQTNASTFAIPIEDFFIRAYRRDDAYGPIRVGWYRHRGTNQYDALFQRPQALATPPEFGGTPPPNEFWYRLRLRRAKSAVVHDSTLRVLNPKGFRLAVRVLEGSPGTTIHKLLRTESSSREIDQILTHPGGVDVLVVIRRFDPSSQPFMFQWFTTLNFVINRFDHPMELRCVDETGWDILGGDEITLEIDPDSQNMPIRLIDDLEGVDSGEALPVPPDAFLPEMTGFQHDLGVKIVESEVGTDDVATNTVLTMAFEEESKRVHPTLKPGTGEYSLHLTLAREPVR